MVVEVIVMESEKAVYKISVEGRVKVSDILRKLGLALTEYVVLKNDVVVTEEEEVVDGDKLVVYPVKSGG